MKHSVMDNEEYFKKIVSESTYTSDALRNLGYDTPSNFYQSFYRYVKKFNVDTSHFLDRSSQMMKNTKGKKYELEDIFVENFQGGVNGTSLKRKLYDNGLKQPICELCGQDENWITGKLTLILDHINGNNKDNRLENLRIVCPNCDSTLPTSKGRNKTKSLSKNKSNYIKVSKENLLNDKNKIIDQIKNSGVDLNSWGVGAKLSKITGKAPQYCLKLINEFNLRSESRK